jgi:hypothetical protein
MQPPKAKENVPFCLADSGGSRRREITAGQSLTLSNLIGRAAGQGLYQASMLKKVGVPLSHPSVQSLGGDKLKYHLRDAREQ